LVRKRIRKNYYKNSLARKKERIVSRCVLWMKLWLVAVAMGGTSLLFILGHDALTQAPTLTPRRLALRETIDFQQRRF